MYAVMFYVILNKRKLHSRSPKMLCILLVLATQGVSAFTMQRLRTHEHVDSQHERVDRRQERVDSLQGDPLSLTYLAITGCVTDC